MTARTYGVAVVGHAFMGKAHSNAWRNVGAFYPDVPRVRQQVLVGRDRAVARDGREPPWAGSRCPPTGRPSSPTTDVDIVDLCIPGHLHATMAVEALAAGKHVLVEKPLANTVAEAEAMVDAAAVAADRGVHAMVGFNYRRIPALALARRYIEDGRIGQVRQARVGLPPGLARRRRRPP